MKPETFGTIVATIVCGALVWWLNSIKDEWSLTSFLTLCISAAALCLLIGWLVDRRRRAGSE
jgi:hypothetical protein